MTKRVPVLIMLSVSAVGLAHAAQGNQLVTATDPVVRGIGSPAETSPGHPQLQRRNPRYQIGRGDVLDVTFPLVAEFNQTVTVQPDGYITLKGAGDIHVEGQTVPEAVASIKQAYSNILHEPSVTVDLKDFEKPYFVAFGHVKKPGKYELRGDTTVIQAIAEAGGFDDATAKHSQVLLFHRESNDWTQVKQLNVKQMLHAQNLTEDLHLQPGDMIFVPQNFSSKFHTWMPNYSTGYFFTTPLQ